MNAARISDIAWDAEIAYGLVYHYFKNKEDILDTIFLGRWGGIHRRGTGGCGRGPICRAETSFDIVVTDRVLDLIEIDGDEAAYYVKIAQTVVELFLNGMGRSDGD